MSILVIVGVTALSLALAVATPAFAVGLRGVGGGRAMHVHNRGFRGAQGDPSYCPERWSRYYDPASGKYMGDDGEWRACL
jgi:hypothetical protein